MSHATKLKVATAITAVCFVLGFYISPYVSAISLGVGVVYTTIQEFREDWSLAILDLIMTMLMGIGGASGAGVFGAVVGLGIAFACSVFLPSAIRETMPFLSAKMWREGKVFKKRSKS